MPVIKHVKNQTPAELPDVCELAIFSVAVVPFALGALEYRIPKYIWSEAGYLRGVQLVRSLQMALLCGGLKEITDRQDSLYRLIDTAIYGTVYEVIETIPELIVAPNIEPTRALSEGADGSIFARMEKQSQMLENALNGTVTSLFERQPGIRDLLEQLLEAAEAESNLDPEMLAQLVQIVGALA